MYIHNIRTRDAIMGKDVHVALRQDDKAVHLYIVHSATYDCKNMLLYGYKFQRVA